MLFEDLGLKCHRKDFRFEESWHYKPPKLLWRGMTLLLGIKAGTIVAAREITAKFPVLCFSFSMVAWALKAAIFGFFPTRHSSPFAMEIIFVASRYASTSRWNCSNQSKNAFLR